MGGLAVREAYTGIDGTYTITNVYPGYGYTIAVSMANFNTSYSPYFEVSLAGYWRSTISSFNGSDRKIKAKRSNTRISSKKCSLNYMKKDNDWRGEKEYRIVIWNKKENDNYDNKIVKINGALKAIVLGLNNNDEEIIHIAKTKNIRVYKLEYDDHINLNEIY